MADYRVPGQWVKDGMVLAAPVTPESIDNLQRFVMGENDVLVASYPKTGTTWVQELVWLVCNKGDMSKARSVPLEERFPFIEFSVDGVTSGLDLVKKMSPPYLMKTHLRSDTYHTQLETGKVKVIIVIRNPKDTLVSFYHFYRMLRPLENYKGTWNEFFELYKAKNLVYGDYFDWYSSWLQYKDRPNVRLIKYEDMHHRMADVINNISQFLNKPLPDNVIPDVIEHLTFDKMRHNDMVNGKLQPVFDFNVSPFLRKGKIGDWKNYFSEEQSAIVDKRYKDVIEACGVHLEFE